MKSHTKPIAFIFVQPSIPEFSKSTYFKPRGLAPLRFWKVPIIDGDIKMVFHSFLRHISWSNMVPSCHKTIIPSNPPHSILIQSSSVLCFVHTRSSVLRFFSLATTRFLHLHSKHGLSVYVYCISGSSKVLSEFCKFVEIVLEHPGRWFAWETLSDWVERSPRRNWKISSFTLFGHSSITIWPASSRTSSVEP